LRVAFAAVVAMLMDVNNRFGVLDGAHGCRPSGASHSEGGLKEKISP
jgi:hypothetical protein